MRPSNGIRRGLLPGCLLACAALGHAEDLGDRWGTESREREYYRIISLPIPEELVLEAGAFTQLPDGRIAVGTRHGDIYLVSGVDGPRPEPTYELFASGLDEIFGLSPIEGGLMVTQSCELTSVTDSDGDGTADRFDTVSDGWGYENYHEYAFGAGPDDEGNRYVALGLSMSYHSRALFRGWVMKVTPEGETIPMASGLRSPGGIGFNETGDLFYMESQGPWNSSCSLKAITEGSFHGHPVSYNWYPFAPNMGDAPAVPESGSRIVIEREKVPELTPYAVVFPYIRMGRSIMGFALDHTGGRFGPFEDQIFLGDFSLSVLLRATTEKVNGVWQGACYPFREGLSTGLLDVAFTPEGNLIAGGTNRGWPVRGIEPFALERVEWTGKVPFEIERISILPDGFDVRFTLPVNPEVASDPKTWALGTFTHIYHAGYGGPEVDQTVPKVKSARVSDDGLTVRIRLDQLKKGHVHEFDLAAMRSAKGEELLHRDAYYTVNEIPAAAAPRAHPVPEDPRWLTYSAKDATEASPHVVFLAGDQEYRSEECMPMLARLFAEKHGMHTTVVFQQDEQGRVEPNAKIKWDDKAVEHDIPGLEYLRSADAVVFYTRLLSLPEAQLASIYGYLDSGKPILVVRTGNHGFIDWDYQVDGKRQRFGEDVAGGAFRGHHGRWSQDSTRATPVPANADHPVLRGVDDVWGPTDVYRTYPEGESLPRDCTALLMGQPLMSRNPTDAPNTDLEPLPVAWTKLWTGASGQTSRVFNTTMGSARDFQCEDMRRLLLNAVLWGLGREDEIQPDLDVDIVGTYEPRKSGFDYEALDVRPRKPAEFR
ncbi:Trehalose utilization [Planctomycetes bacterium Poly30]|uniref:Trehalose utilization n=1 Tax=Saltatorellus ferox TaxID=2528018 RepID=A0A518ET00_9BACT|nr:Trehalose utilization [Planctomycetes bacterium Poly30]